MKVLLSCFLIWSVSHHLLWVFKVNGLFFLLILIGILVNYYVMHVEYFYTPTLIQNHWNEYTTQLFSYSPHLLWVFRVNGLFFLLVLGSILLKYHVMHVGYLQTLNLIQIIEMNIVLSCFLIPPPLQTPQCPAPQHQNQADSWWLPWDVLTCSLGLL